ncbi:MAG: hypothetical protein AMXMBFR83_18230 [Phycisphaerae bacterium]
MLTVRLASIFGRQKPGSIVTARMGTARSTACGLRAVSTTPASFQGVTGSPRADTTTVSSAPTHAGAAKS